MLVEGLLWFHRKTFSFLHVPVLFILLLCSLLSKRPAFFLLLFIICRNEQLRIFTFGFFCSSFLLSSFQYLIIYLICKCFSMRQPCAVIYLKFKWKWVRGSNAKLPLKSKLCFRVWSWTSLSLYSFLRSFHFAFLSTFGLRSLTWRVQFISLILIKLFFAFLFLGKFYLLNFPYNFNGGPLTGLYLYMLVVETFSGDNLKFNMYALIGWGKLNTMNTFATAHTLFFSILSTI